MKNTPAANGWPVIGRYLRQRSLTQSELAGALAISAAAVTHIKQGSSWLDAGQLATVARFLAMSEADQEEFYTQIFNTRIIGGTGTAWHPRYECRQCQPSGTQSVAVEPDLSLPPLPLSRLVEFSPAVETLPQFLSRLTGRSRMPQQVPVCAAGNPDEPPLPPGSRIWLDPVNRPASGDTVLARLHSGPFIIAEAQWGEELIFTGAWIDHKKTGIRWKYRSDPGWVVWMAPIRKLTLDFSASRAEDEVTGS